LSHICSRHSACRTNKEDGNETFKLCGKNYFEQEIYKLSPLDHFLNRVSAASMQSANEPSVLFPQTAEKRKAFLCISFNELRNISPSDETYQVRFRLYVVWAPPLNSLFEKHVSSAKEKSSGYISLTQDEVDEFVKSITIPEISFPAAISTENTDPPSIRVYSKFGGFALWNAAYTIDHAHTFDLRRFPFDVHDMPFRVAQNNGLTWSLFDLTVQSVQFHRDALESTEWTIRQPRIKRVSTKQSKIILQVERKSSFYIQNIVGIMSALSILGFSVFAMDEESLPDRVNTILTLLLTAVAFKFAIGDSIPKVGYNTIFDRFFLMNMLCMFKVIFVCVIWSLFEEPVDTMLSGTMFTLNRILFFSSFAIFVIMNILWICLVKQKRSGEHKAPKIALEKNRNWYSCVFSNPIFFNIPSN